jgi:pyruvate/2-oxoglutarate dehydrogenase complex dihydrolipoamide acyltransferase (E2) component
VAAPAVAEPAPKAPAKKAPARKTAEDTALKPSTAPAPTITAEQRNHYVSVAAFYIAERRGFTLGDPGLDWLEAEAEIDRLIASGHFVA